MTDFSCGFVTDHIGKTIQMQISLWSRLWFLFQWHCMGRNPDPPGLFVIVDVKNCRSAVIEPAFVCDTCGRAMPWSSGCADDRPMSCDDCYITSVSKGD